VCVFAHAWQRLATVLAHSRKAGLSDKVLLSALQRDPRPLRAKPAAHDTPQAANPSVTHSHVASPTHKRVVHGSYTLFGKLAKARNLFPQVRPTPSETTLHVSSRKQNGKAVHGSNNLLRILSGHNAWPEDGVARGSHPNTLLYHAAPPSPHAAMHMPSSAARARKNAVARGRRSAAAASAAADDDTRTRREQGETSGLFQWMMSLA
jgi:hypothetical protein